MVFLNLYHAPTHWISMCGLCCWCRNTAMKFYPTWCMCNLLFKKAFSELIVFLLCMAQIWNPPAVENDYDMLHHPQMKSHLRGIIIFRFYQVHVLYWITKFLTTYKIYRSLLDSSIPFTRLLCYAEQSNKFQISNSLLIEFV